MSDNLRFKKNLLETFDPVSGIMYQLRMGSVATNTTILSSVVSSMIMGASHADGEFGFEFDVYDAQGTNDAYLNYLVRYNSNQTVKTLNIVTINDTDTNNPQVILNASKINFDTFSTGASFGAITDISYISSQSISTNVLSSGTAYVGSLTGSNISTINIQANQLDVRTINVINVSTFTLSTQSVIANSISTLAISSGTTTMGTTTAGSMTVTGLSTTALSSGVAIIGGITALGLSTLAISSGTGIFGTLNGSTARFSGLSTSLISSSAISTNTIYGAIGNYNTINVQNIVGTNNAFVITPNNALPALVGNRIYWATDYALPDSGRFIFGDGTGWRLHISKRVSNVTSDLFTIRDNGHVSISDGDLTGISSVLRVQAGLNGANSTANCSQIVLESKAGGGATVGYTISQRFNGSNFALEFRDFLNNVQPLSLTNTRVQTGCSLDVINVSYPSIGIQTTAAGTYRASMYFDQVANKVVFDNTGNAYPFQIVGSGLGVGVAPATGYRLDVAGLTRMYAAVAGEGIVGSTGRFLSYSMTVRPNSENTTQLFTILDNNNVEALSVFENGTFEGITAPGNAVLYVGRDTGTLRSINARGTVNANGTDFAEYMKKNGDFNIAKGDICGIDANGLLTNKWSEAKSFQIKSTNPGLTCGDPLDLPRKPEKTENMTDEQHEAALAEYKSFCNAERAPWDRIAFSGQIPVNVTGAQAGDYIVAAEGDNDAITGIVRSSADITFDEYRRAIGRVLKIQDDGKAFVKVIVH